MSTFKAGLDNRDVFLGKRRCVICGISEPESLRRCRIYRGEDYSKHELWYFLVHLGWVPTGVKPVPEYERNALVMCANHHRAFQELKFFIRFRPATKQYIFVYYDSYREVTRSQHLQQYHGKAIAVNVEDECAPLPLLFLVHEYLVRGRNPFQPTSDEEVTVSWQKWMVLGGVVNEKDDGTLTFNRDAPTSLPPPRWSGHLQVSPTTAAPHSCTRNVITPPSDDVVEELLAYQRTTRSWKAWQREIMAREERRERT